MAGRTQPRQIGPQEATSFAMKRVFVLGPLVLALLTGVARAEMKIAFVDVQRALNECDAGKKAKADFRGQIEKLEGRLQKQQNDVQALKDEIEKKGMLMKEDERRNIEDEYQRKLRDFERDYKDSRDDLEKRDNEVTGAIVRDLARIIRDLGERDGYTVVMEKGSILWGTPSIDVTDQVIRSYNASGGKIGALGGPAPEAAAGSGGQGVVGSSAGAPASGSNFGDAAAKRSTISK